MGTGKSAKAIYRLTAAGAREALARVDAIGREALRAALGQVEQAIQSIQTALAPLRAALAAPAPAPSAAPPAPAPPPQPAPAPQPASLPAEPRPTPLGRDRLRDVLREKYEYLCELIEFQDRLVELPRLYDKSQEALPGLSVQRFHDELLSLWDERKVELHILNEVRNAKRPELGIRRHDALYYFILWKDRS